MSSSRFAQRLPVATVAALWLASGLSSAAAGQSYARDYPNAVVFLQMARRGAVDFAAQYGRLPTGLPEIASGGHSAYLFPAAWQPQFEPGQGRLRIGRLGEPVYFAGEFLRAYSVDVTMPQAGLFHDVNGLVAHTANDAAQLVAAPQRIWHFPGAQWLAAGLGPQEVEEALRLERIFVHLNWMTYEYSKGLGTMPRDLADLETLAGTPRNQACWQGVQEVASAELVRWQGGNLYVGWDRGAWVISANLGPEVATRRWTASRRGEYSCGCALAY